MENDQRKHTRKAAFIIAEYTTKEGTFKDVLNDVSADGLFVSTWRRYEYGESIVLKFPLFSLDHIIQVRGKVIRNESDGFAISFDEPIQGLMCKEGYFPEIVQQSDQKQL